jgi:hypothetical protein
MRAVTVINGVIQCGCDALAASEAFAQLSKKSDNLQPYAPSLVVNAHEWPTAVAGVVADGESRLIDDGELTSTAEVAPAYACPALATKSAISTAGYRAAWRSIPSPKSGMF